MKILHSGKISIIMGVYNCEKTIREAIDSILNQTYINWEFIICDDCSSDGTLSVLQEYKAKYPEKFVILQNERNRKLAYSLNRCLQQASGKFVARMDGDDISLPERFEKQIRFLQEHPDVDMVGTSMQHFDEQGLGDIVRAVKQPDKYTLRYSGPVMHATLMTYKRVYDALDGYRVIPQFDRGEDYELWFRFYACGLVAANLQEVLYLNREDDAAFRRRTFRVRWQTFQIKRQGFRLLGYPSFWVIEAFIITIIKSLIPVPLMKMYRRYNKMKDEG